MSVKKKHLEIVNDNFEALCHLSSPDPSDHTNWSTTIIFYMALHYIHAYLSKKDDHPSNHDPLKQKINSLPELKPLYKKYRDLQIDSESARYFGKKLSTYQMRNETLKWFNDIQNKVCELLNISNNKYDLYNLFPPN